MLHNAYTKSAEAITIEPELVAKVLSGDLLPADILNKVRVRPHIATIELGRSALRLAKTIELDNKQRFIFHLWALNMHETVTSSQVIEIAEGPHKAKPLLEISKVVAGKLRNKINEAAGDQNEIVQARDRSMGRRAFCLGAIHFIQRADAPVNEGFAQMDEAERLAFFQQVRALTKNGWPQNTSTKAK